MMLMPPAPAPGRTKPVKGDESVGAGGGNWPQAGLKRHCGSMKKTLPARTSMGSARPSSPRSSDCT